MSTRKTGFVLSALLGVLAMVEAGQRALVAFIIQRDEVASLCEARHHDVDLKAWTCRVDLHGIILEGQVPLCLRTMPKGEE